ncbi:transposase [Myceligenerans sp. I2]|uniref:Transposase n=2 Tax=Myceligenerans indicum TaxID=2593663 RepID=A0ABS1LPG3_9MICO|nr:transposase [Myceligenerans indicum]
MRYQSTCGLAPAQMTELIARAWQVHAGRPAADRYDFTLPFGKATVMVLLIARHNLPQQLAGDLFGIAQATVSRIWRYLLPLIGQVTALDRKHLADALARGTVLIDGTPIPTGNRAATGRTNYVAKHHKQALCVQVAAFRDGTLADVSRPVPGSRHDSRALDEVGWADQIATARAQRDWIAVIADTAYIKHTRLTPRKKPRGQKRRSKPDREHNRHISSLRAPVERTIAVLKQWKILATGYRGRLTELPTLIHMIVNLEFYRQAT